MYKSIWVRWLVILFPVLLLPVFLWFYWPYPRNAFYSLYREQGKARTLHGLQDYDTTETQHFKLWYAASDKVNAELILETAETVYDAVVKAVGYHPAGQIPLIVYPDRAVLRQAFGWGNGESAMGVYWEGTIRLLSPNAWLSEQNTDRRNKAFRRLNPIAHEMAHYLLDYKTGGNYQRWFTEGLAQRVEHEITGYLWIEPRSTLRQHLYTMDDLSQRFDQLTNQPLAYRQSYLLVEYMIDEYGETSLNSLIERLTSGMRFEDAVRLTYGRSMTTIYNDWVEWIDINLEGLDPAV